MRCLMMRRPWGLFVWWRTTSHWWDKVALFSRRICLVIGHCIHLSEAHSCDEDVRKYLPFLSCEGFSLWFFVPEEQRGVPGVCRRRSRTGSYSMEQPASPHIGAPRPSEEGAVGGGAQGDRQWNQTFAPRQRRVTSLSPPLWINRKFTFVPTNHRSFKDRAQPVSSLCL